MPARHAPILVVFLLALAGLGCASSGPSAGTGDVAFRVAWDGVSDLDLLVLDPSGECIFFGHREAASGGLLDIDCNANPEATCERPIENIYWPTTTAPSGRYHVWVRAQLLVPEETPLALEMKILEGHGSRTRTRWSSTFEVTEQQQVVGPYVYDQDTSRVEGPVEGVEVPGECTWRAFALRPPGA